ncbi:ABC transporter permease [Nostoc sp. T09]|uniref:ABC transporter permease n=1 Tax=Nostoc sp. T09 TaxID=1932621 RepID=UPI00211B2B17|nr:ABC transporter permease [Nostoc sp. T09]
MVPRCFPNILAMPSAASYALTFISWDLIRYSAWMRSLSRAFFCWRTNPSSSSTLSWISICTTPVIIHPEYYLILHLPSVAFFFQIGIILAKIAPLLVLLTFDAVIALIVGRIAFNLPFRGNFLVFISISILYFFVGISIGIIIASYAKSEQQALLTTFFVNPPLVLLSGGNSPILAMPTFMQWLSYLDPMRYFIEVCRGVLLKGVGFEALWPQVLILLVFATVLMTLSIRQFRHQLT